MKMVEEVDISKELYVKAGHSIGGGLYQYYYREATWPEIQERVGVAAMSDSLEYYVKRVHELEAFIAKLEDQVLL